MNKLDTQLKELYSKILEKENFRIDRTGVGTKSIFVNTVRCDLREGFPLTTLRKIHIKSLIHELLWFLGAYDKKYERYGNTNIKYLCDNNVTFWDEWCYKDYVKQHGSNITIEEFGQRIKDEDFFSMVYGDLGPVYGKQWLNFDGVNQIDELINDLKTNPDSRRMIVSAWNVGDIKKMKLPPCHILWQCYTEPVENSDMRYIDLHLYMRSSDQYLGFPFNIASYALLLHMIAQVVDMIPREIIITTGDTHLYSNSIDATNELLKRDIRDLPLLKLNPNIKNIYDFRYEDFEILNYNPHPNIKVQVAV
jgi:thymidylate synthase